MKTLIIAAHPHIAQSVVNKCWLDKLAKHPDRFTVHRLYTAYPDGKIDIAREQALVEAHGGIVFQFPVYWFNCPPLLKQWFDDVLTYGWAYGSAGRAFAGRKTGIAVSLGAPAEDYRPNGAVGYGLDDVLRPFELTARYFNADWQPPFAFHAIDSNAGYDEAAERLVAQSAADYLAHLEGYFD